MKKYLIMEYYGGELKVLEVRKSRKQYEINRYFKVDVFDPEAPESEIITRLRESGIKAEKVIFISKSSTLKNIVKSFPKMPRRELKLVIEREVRKEVKEEKVFFDFTILEKKEGKRGIEEEVLISIAPEELIWKTFSFIRSIEKFPLIITSFYQSFVSAKKILKIEEDNNSFGILNITSKKSSFLIFKANSEYVLEREIVSTGENIFREEALETLLMEINRTIQYFKQKNRGFEISTIYITGVTDGIEGIAVSLNETLPFSVVPLPTEKITDFFKVKLKRDDNPQKFISEYFSLFGGIFLPEVKDKINLLPSYYYEKEAYNKRIISFSIISFLLMFILFLSTFFIEKTKSSLRNDLKKQNDVIASIRNRLQKIENIKRQREKYYDELLSLGKEKKGIEKIILFFDFLTLNTPKGIHLTQCTIIKEGITYKIKIEGLTDSIFPFVANQLFKSFYDKLSAYPLLSDFSFSLTQKMMGEEGVINKTVETMKDITQKITDSEKTKKEKKQKLFFKINFRIKIL